MRAMSSPDHPTGTGPRSKLERHSQNPSGLVMPGSYISLSFFGHGFQASEQLLFFPQKLDRLLPSPNLPQTDRLINVTE